MTKGRTTTNKPVKKSLQEFLQDTSTKASPSWADDVENDKIFPVSDSTMTDLRATIEAAPGISTRIGGGGGVGGSPPYRAPREYNQQFEHDAEEKSTAWTREQRRSPFPSTTSPSVFKTERRPLLESHVMEEGKGMDVPFSTTTRPRTTTATIIAEEALPTEAPFVLFIKNLPYTTSRDEIAEFFESNGDIRIENIVLPIDRERQGRLKGFGYLIFPDFESMRSASQWNGMEFRGRPIVVDVPTSEVAQRVASRSSEGPFGRRMARRQGPEAPQTISDQSENWRGSAGADNVSDVFGRRKQRQSREGEESGDFEASFQRRKPREERSPKPSFEEQFQRQRDSRERREEWPRRKDGERPFRKRAEEAPAVDENDPLFAATGAAPERRKLVLKERTVAEPIGAKAKSTGIFGEGKPWEETEQLREHMEKLAFEAKPQVAAPTESKKEKKPRTPTTPAADKGKNVEHAKSDEKEFVSKKRDKNVGENTSPSRTGRWFDETSSSGKSGDVFERRGKRADKRQNKEVISNKKEVSTAASSTKREPSSTGNKKEMKKDENVWGVLEQVEE